MSFLLLLLLLSNSISLRRDKSISYPRRDKSILYSRAIILGFLLGNLVLINNILAMAIDFNVVIYNGIFTITWHRLLLHLILSNIYICIFYIKIKDNNSHLFAKFTSKLIYKSLNLNYIFSFLPELQLAIHLVLPFSYFYEVRMCIFPPSEAYALNEEMLSSLKHMKRVVEELENMKRTKGIRYIVDIEGNLSLDLPNSISDIEAEKLSKTTGALDKFYNTQFEKYKELVSKDEKLNDKLFSSRFNKNYQNILSKHRALIETEN